MQWIVRLASQILIRWIVIYPVDSAIQCLNNRGPGVDYFRIGVAHTFLRETRAKIRFVQNRVTLGPSSQTG